MKQNPKCQGPSHTKIAHVLGQVLGATCPVSKIWITPLPCDLTAQCLHVTIDDEFWTRGVRDDRRSYLTYVDCLLEQKPQANNPLSPCTGGCLSLWHPAFMQQLLSCPESESTAERDIQDVSVYSKVNYLGAVEFWGGSLALTEDRAPQPQL